MAVRQHIVTLLLLLFSILGAAQTSLEVSIPYTMNFEQADSLELQNWVLNPGGLNASLAKDRWTVGTGTHSDGQQSLYITNLQNPGDPMFGASPCVQYAYRDFVLPRGTYVITFDWRCMGTNEAALYAGVGPAESMPEMEARCNVATFSADLNNFMLEDCRRMRGCTRWSNQVIDAVAKSTTSTTYISSNGKRAIRLFFIWSNGNTNPEIQVPLGACIDNIQITSANCLIPETIEAEALNCDSLRIKWLGSSEDYELEYRMSSKTRWINLGIIPVVEGEDTTSIILENLDEGMYNFRVRGICHGDSGDVYSAWRYLNNYVFYCRDKHYINYMDLADSLVTCYYGTFWAPDINKGLVDYGPDDAYSRHTVIWDLDAMDPRTNYMLPMVNPGSFASVRLGNWLPGAQAEAITYQIKVDKEKAGILLLNYAMVLEDPNHDRENQPMFKLEILAKNAYDEWELVNACGMREFHADHTAVGTNGWHQYLPPSGLTPVLYRDWTTVGLDLQSYDGQDILIRLTTYDCSQSGHYGYAYFSLDCRSAKITSPSCGEEDVISIDAPAGFSYRWYKNYGRPDSVFVSDSLALQLTPSDTTTYTCVLRSIEMPDCFFTLSTNSILRFPLSEFDYEYTPAECQNKLRLHNTSHIITRFNGDIQHHTDESCEYYEWMLLNTTTPSDTIYRYEKNPVLTLPTEGGRYWATLSSYIADGACHHDTTIWIDIPKIGDTETIIDSTICDGAYLVLGDKFSDQMHYAADPGTYHVTWKSMAGCDSMYTYNVTVHPQDKVYLPDTTICAEEMLCIDGDCYRKHETGNWVRFKVNRFGCDSTIWLAVTVEDSILPHVVMTDIVGDNEYTGAFDISGTGYDYFTLNGTRYEAAVNRIDSLNGGEFELVFYNNFGCEIRQLHQMNTPCYNMIMQRWGDVLSVVSASQLGSIDPISFQWMQDGVDIPEATRSYYYAEDGLNLNSAYAVRVITGTGEEIISCDFHPTPYTAPQMQPAARKQVQNGQLIIILNNSVFNAQGERLK